MFLSGASCLLFLLFTPHTIFVANLATERLNFVNHL